MTSILSNVIYKLIISAFFHLPVSYIEVVLLGVENETKNGPIGRALHLEKRTMVTCAVKNVPPSRTVTVQRQLKTLHRGRYSLLPAPNIDISLSHL